MSAEYHVIWTPVAERDLRDIIEYIAVDNLAAAQKAANEIQGKAETLAAFPRRGRVVPELQHVGILWYRELIIRPWSIFYRIEHETVCVLGVVDRRRDITTILLERLMR